MEEKKKETFRKVAHEDSRKSEMEIFSFARKATAAQDDSVSSLRLLSPPDDLLLITEWFRHSATSFALEGANRDASVEFLFYAGRRQTTLAKGGSFNFALFILKVYGSV